MLDQLPVRPQGKPNSKKTPGKIGFVQLAKLIGKRWKNLDRGSRAYFDSLAAEEKNRYTRLKKELEMARVVSVDEISTNSLHEEQDTLNDTFLIAAEPLDHRQVGNGESALSDNEMVDILWNTVF